MKLLLKIVLVLVLLVAVVIGAGALYVASHVNSLAKKGIESGGTYALGVQTTVQDVSLSIMKGELEIEHLKVANPAGFAAPHFLDLKDGDLAVNLSSLQSDVIEVPTLHLSGIDVNLERKDGNANYKAILDNLQKLRSGSSSSSSSSKKLIIRDLQIIGIRVHADMLGGSKPLGQVVGAVTKLDVPIEKIQLTDVGRTGAGVKGTGVTVEELTSIIVQAVLAAAAENGGGILPADLLGDLQSRIASLGGLDQLGATVVGKAGDTAKKFGQGAQKAIDDVGKAAGKAVGDVGDKVKDAIDNIIPGKKDDKDAPKKKP
jgi:hypothetical protein